MPIRATTLARALLRRAALDDLRLTLPAARFALRLLRLSARTSAERDAADAAAHALDVARGITRCFY